jgi:uncharacterized protein (TIGR02118 family)
MVKLIALYTRPADVAAFERHYREVHTPLVKAMPGLRRLEVSRTTGAPMGEPRYYLVAEMFFDDAAALRAALKSPEGLAAGKDLMSFARDLVHMMFADIEA